MSLATGSVTIDGSGNATGSGMALAIYNAIVSAFGASVPATGASLIAWKTGQASFAVALATGIVPYLTANAVIGAGTFKDSVNNNATTGNGTFT
jgi:hypothetical protein